MSKPLSITTVISISFATIATAGEITTDGSMGTATNLTGPNYTIAQDLGTTVGNNLFHSFGTFNLSQGDVATFTGANTIQNVISRVTDGNPSSIDGTIESQVGNANFFFINPAGVVFGQHAVVDVPAAFHASTANELRFADGTAYNLVTPKGSLTAAPPEAFGFLGATGDIVIEGSQLKFKEGAEISFTGGSVTSNNATIEVPRGSLRVYGNGDAVSNVPITGELPVGNGAITLNGGMWDVSGNGGGNIQISGGAVSVINEAKIYNDNNGLQNTAGKLHITANALLIDSGRITADAISSGNAGSITINVNGEMQILNGGRVSSRTSEQGNAGTITITANRLVIDSQGLQIFTGIASSAEENSSGDAAAIIITVNGEMQVLNRGEVSSDTWATGNAGTVIITASRLVIKGQGNKYGGITSGAYSGSTGNAGAVTITVNGEMHILNAGEVSSDTWGTGNAGTVTITANLLIVERQGKYGGITSGAYPGSTGDAGAITITVNGEMHILNGGEVSSSTFAQGNAGTVTITANRLVIDSQGSQTWTGINSGVHPDSTGNAGTIIITVNGEMQVLNGGMIFNANYGTGNAGSIIIKANRLLHLDNGTITTTAQTGQGGDITITASAIVLNNGQITTSVLGTGGNGGDITLNGGYLVLDTGFIQANTEGKDAKGGNIFINMDGLLSNGGVTHIGGWKRETFTPNSGRNVIQAAANARENYGSITFKNPNDDTASSIGASFKRLEPIKLAKHPCEGTKGRFNFRRRYDVGLPNSGGDLIKFK